MCWCRMRPTYGTKSFVFLVQRMAATKNMQIVKVEPLVMDDDDMRHLDLQVLDANDGCY